jgi:hypothetical protein
MFLENLNSTETKVAGMSAIGKPFFIAKSNQEEKYYLVPTSKGTLPNIIQPPRRLLPSKM